MASLMAAPQDRRNKFEAELPKDLQDHFRKRTRRRVARDRTLVLNDKLYEAPIPLIGKQVLVLYQEKDL
jgi:putative transposase